MQKKDAFTRGLAIVGTVLACIPILMTLLTSLASPFIAGRFLMDYLMPAELGLFALAGALLLLWAAFRAHARLVTGLASGEVGIGGWQWAVVVATLVLYIVALIVIDVSGILLTRDLFRPVPPAISN